MMARWGLWSLLPGYQPLQDSFTSLGYERIKGRLVDTQFGKSKQFPMSGIRHSKIPESLESGKPLAGFQTIHRYHDIIPSSALSISSHVF